VFSLFDAVRCPTCEDIVLVIMPSQELDPEEYKVKQEKHDKDKHAIDYLG